MAADQVINGDQQPPQGGIPPFLRKKAPKLPPFLQKKVEPITPPVAPAPKTFSWQAPTVDPVGESTHIAASVPNQVVGMTADIHAKEVSDATERLSNLDLKPAVKNIMTHRKREDDLQQTASQIPIDNTANTQLLQHIQHLLPKAAPVSDEEVDNVVKDLPNNPGLTREAVGQMAQKDNKVKADAYRADSANRPRNTEKIIQNAKALEDGQLDYDVNSGRLVKPIGFMDAFGQGWRDRKGLLNGYEAMDGKTEEQKIAYLKADVPKTLGPDDPIPVMESIPSVIGSMAGSDGIPMAKAIGASMAVEAAGSFVPGVGTAAVSHLAAAAAAAITAPEYFKRSYYQTLNTEFHSLTAQGMDEKSALKEAEHRAKVAGITDATVNGAMNFVAIRSGLKPAAVQFSGGYRKIAQSIIKSSMSFGKEAVGEGAAVGTLAVAGRVVKNINEGKPTWQNADEDFLHSAAMVIGLKAFTRVGSTLFKSIKDAGIAKENIIKQPDALIQQQVGEMLHDGSITPEEAHEALTNIAQAKAADAAIPPSVTDEKARIEIKEKIAEFNDNKAKLAQEADGGLHESLHGPIKERQKDLEWEINMLSARPEEQVTILKTKQKELQTELDAHDKSVEEGKAGKLPDRAATKKQLGAVDKKLAGVQDKLDSPLYQAQKMIDDKVDKGELTGVYAQMAQSDAHGFLKFVAEQAQGQQEFEGAMVSSKPETVKSFGQDLVDKAIELFPKPPEPAKSSISVILPQNNKPNENITTVEAKPLHTVSTPGVRIKESPLSVEPTSQFEGHPLAENKSFNKDSPAPFTTSQGHSVKRENGELVVTNKQGKVLSTKEARDKAIAEYAEVFDYSHGEVAPPPSEGMSHPDIKRHIVESSQNPVEIAEIHAWEAPQSRLSTKEGMIAEFGIGKVKRDSYIEFGDRNNIGVSKAKTYFNNKGRTLDVIAKEMSDHYGVEVTPADLVEFIDRFPNGSAEAMRLTDSDVAVAAKAKFKALTGMDLTPQIAEKAINHEFNQLSKIEQAIAEANHENTQALQDAYEQQLGATDGFTKEDTGQPVAPQGGTAGEDSGQGPAEPPQIGGTAPAEVPQEHTTGIKNAVTKAEREVRGLSEVEVQVRRSFPEAFDKGKEMVDSGQIDPRLLAKELAVKPRALNAEESVALIYDRMRLHNEHRQITEDIHQARAEGNDTRAEILEGYLKDNEDLTTLNDEAARRTGYEQGLGLAARKMMIKQDYSLANQVQQYKTANKGEDLPAEVRAKLEEQTTKLKEALDKIDEYEKQVAALKAEQAVREAAKEHKPGKGAKTKPKGDKKDYKKERDDIFKNIKKKWDDAGNDNTLTAVPLPYSKQLAAIAPEVAKLLKSYAEQGIVELGEIVRDVHANLTANVHKDITEKDVIDLLAGEYKEKKTPPTLDKEAMKLKANAEKIKYQIDAEKERIRLAKRNKFQKGVDYFQKWRRAAILSGVKVLGKIGVAAAMRSGVTSPIESVIGSGLRHIPGLSKIAKGAPREGAGFSPKAEAKALSQWVDRMTYKDIREVLSGGKGQLDYLYSDKIHPPSDFLDFFGQLHAAIKTLPKRSEFFRSFELRAEHALKNGKDMTDPVVQQEIAAGAYQDCLRAIFMQENYVTSAYKSAIRALETTKVGGAGGKGLAEMMKFLFPIVKVPTNYVAEESSYMIGSLKAAAILARNFRELTPEHKDYVMRALKKQTIGLAFIALGYFNPQAVGGYYSGKRRDDDLQAGDLHVLGVNVPHWMAHTPLLEALQLGATLRRIKDREIGNGKDANVLTGLPVAFKGIANQVPFFNTTGQFSNAFSSLDGAKMYLSRMGQSVVEPQLIKEIAEWTDTDPGGDQIKRDPKTLLEQMKTGIPGLREQVKERKSSGGSGVGAGATIQYPAEPKAPQEPSGP